MKTFWAILGFAAACLLGVGMGRFTAQEEAAVPEKADTLSAAVLPSLPVEKENIFDGCAVAEAILPSVVAICTADDDTPIASGLLFSEDGYVLSALVSGFDDQEAFYVTLSDGLRREAVCLVQDDERGIAVLKVDSDGLTPAVFCRKPSLQAAQPVLLAAADRSYPYARCVACGMVSSLHDASIINGIYADGLLQVEATLHGAVCGAPLVDARHEVVGLCLADTSAEHGVLALPIEFCLPVTDAFLEKGSFVTVSLGLTCQNSKEPQEVSEGMVITHVSQGSPAMRAGLQEGDILLCVDGQTPRTMAELHRLNALAVPGSILSLHYRRNGMTYRTDCLLQKEPTDETGEPE